MARKPWRGLGWLGGGKESPLKSVKTASRTRKAAGAREGRPRRCREREKQASRRLAAGGGLPRGAHRQVFSEDELGTVCGLSRPVAQNYLGALETLYLCPFTGIVLHTGPSTARFGDGLFAVPMASFFDT